MINGNPYRRWRILAVTLGIISAWYGRHIMNPDGVSYLELADAWRHGDWAHAISAYWSPLYSWAIALSKLILQPSAYWEFACVHAVNLAFYLVSLVCYERFLRRFLAWRLAFATGELPPGVERLYRTIGFCIFLWVGLWGINLVNTTPDQMVAAVVYLACSLLLDMKLRLTHWSSYALFGFVLGIGYLTKAAMFPIGFLFLLAALPYGGALSPASLRRWSVAVATFLITCAPFVLALSTSKGRFTFGDSGRINYAEEISGIRRVSHWQGDVKGAGTPVHPTTQIHTHPEVFAFDSVPGGFYPVWTDPSYWYEGVRFKMDAARQAKNLVMNAAAALCILLLAPGAVGALLTLVFVRRKPLIPRCLWFLLLPSAGTVLLYCIVLMSTRYVSMFVGVLCLVLAGAARFESLTKVQLRIVAAGAYAAILCVCGWFMLVQSYSAAWDLVHMRELNPNRQWLLAQDAQRIGLQAGARVGYIGVTTCAYWLHLSGARVIAEVPMVADLDRGLTSSIHENMREIETYWRSSDADRRGILDLMRSRGAVMIFADKIPSWADTEGWIRLPTALPSRNGSVVTYGYRFSSQPTLRTTVSQSN